MTADDPTQVDEQFAVWLAASAEALAEGSSPTLPDPGIVPAELRPRMERALAGLQLLQQLRPPSNATLVSPQRAPELQTDPPWKTLGRFQLIREIGRGGFGIVYLAHDPLLQRAVALKVPRPEAVISPELRQRFYQEARAASTLQHANLVTVYEAGEVGPVCFIVYAYCPGITLAQWLKEQSEPVPFATSARLIATLADAVAHAHQHGVVHRDLKPSNVLLQIADCGLQIGEKPNLSSQSAIYNLQSAIPRITDFGLAKNFLESPCDPTTRSGAIVGTVSYMAPEQARGKTRALGPGTDIYALGAILYELLTGRTPFQGESDLDTLLQVQFEEPLPPARLRPRIPRDLETICLKCLQKEPQRRYPSAAALEEDLQRFLAGKPVLARPVSRSERLLRWCKRNPLPAALTASVAALLFFSSIGSLIAARWMQHGRDRAQRAERDTKLELCRGYFSQARASRRGNDPGRRFRSRELLTKTIQLRDELSRPDLLPTELELRNELIGCLAQADLSPAPQWQGLPIGYRSIAFDARLQVYARSEDPATVRIARVADDAQIFRFEGTSSGTALLRLSPDAHFVAFVQNDRRLRLGDVQLQQHFVPNVDPLSPLALDFSPDSCRLAAGHEDGRITLYDLARRAILSQTRIPARPKHLAFHPDGRTLAISDQASGAVFIHDVLSKRLDRILCPQKAGAVGWSADGQFLAVAGDNGRIFLWEPSRQRMRSSLEGHQGGGVQISFASSGRLLASFGWDGMLRLWDVRAGTPLFSTRSTTHDLRFSPDSRWLASSINGTQLGFWQVAAGQEHRTIALGYQPGAPGLPADTSADISNDDRFLVVPLDGDGGIRVWDLESGREIGSIPTRASESAVFTPDGKALLTDGRGGLYRWSLQGSGSADLLKIGPPEKLHSDHIRLFKSRPAGEMVGATVRGKGGTILSMSPRPAIGPMIKELEGTFLSVSPDGRWIATGQWNGRGIKVWDTRNHQSRELLSEDGIFAVRFSPDNRWLLASIVSSTEEYRSWTVASWEPCLRLPRSYGGRLPGVMAFSPDGKLLAVETEPARLQLVNPATGQGYATLEDPGGHSALWASFTRDGARLVVLTANTLQIWDLRLLRAGLAEYGLDWDLPAYPPAKTEAGSGLAELKVELSADFYADRGYQHNQRQEFAKAVADYQKALDLDPRALERESRHAVVCNDLAWYCVTGPAQDRDPAKALRLAEKATAARHRKDATYWNYQNTLGVVYYRLGRWQDAVATLQTAAAARDRGSAAAWDLYFLAMSYQRLGESSMARTCYEKASAIEKRDQDKLRAEERIELKEIRTEADVVLALPEQIKDKP